ncbi:MAG: hypothetical protein ABIG90_03695 [bacterium]
MLFEILGDVPEKISHVLWDVDGVRTSKDEVPLRVTDWTIKLSQQGVRQSFITGRDAQWLVDMEIKPLKKAGLTEMPNSLWMPELGLVNIDFESERFEINSEFQGHPLLRPEIRYALLCLSHNQYTTWLWSHGQDVPEDYYLAKDANGVMLLISRTTINMPLRNYIWSEYKLVCGTYEILRDENGDSLEADPANDAKIVEKYIDSFGLAKDINILTVSTAVSLWPKGVDKTWSATTAIQASKIPLIPLEETIAFGDSVSDFPMSLNGKIAFAFVGLEEQWDLFEKSGIKASVVFKAKSGHKGPEVVLEILEYVL